MRIAWVHPSWRDLVIDRLADDAAARREFLAACGIEGALLALSTGGGRAGERQLPLLREDADWDAFGGGLHALVRDADDPCLVRLLGALATALGARIDAGGRSELAALARTALEDVRERLALLLSDHAPATLRALGFPKREAERVLTLCLQAQRQLDRGAGDRSGALELIVERGRRLLPERRRLPRRTPKPGQLQARAVDPEDRTAELVAAYAERRLVERVLGDL